jgi:hypothetical protein
MTAASVNGLAVMSDEPAVREAEHLRHDADALDEDTVHVTCCQDEDFALCGVDVAGRQTYPDETPTGCTVCAALEERSCTEVCPLVLIGAVDSCEGAWS